MAQEKQNTPFGDGEKYKLFEGYGIVEMPKLVAEGRVPLGVSQIMEKRLECGDDSPKLQNYWMAGLNTGDAILFHPSGRMKIDLNSQYLLKMDSESPRFSNELLLPEEYYSQAGEEEFEKKDLGGNLGYSTEETGSGFWLYPRFSSREAIIESPIWRNLVRDSSLLEEYVDYVFFEKNLLFGKGWEPSSYSSDQRLPSFSLEIPTKGNIPTIKNWFIEKFESGYLCPNSPCYERRLVGEVSKIKYKGAIIYE